MRITELAKALGLDVGIHYIGWLPKPIWQAKLEPGLQHSEVRFQDKSSNPNNINVIGNGTNPEEALTDLAKELAGKMIVMRTFFCDSEVEFLVSNDLLDID